MKVQGSTKRECFITAITDKPVKFADTATKVCFTPDLDDDQGHQEGLNTYTKSESIKFKR